jgi:myo-inositol-1(or 4)-monophosphatase
MSTVNSTGGPPNNSSSQAFDLGQCLTVAFNACEGAAGILNHYFGHLTKIDEKFQAGLVSEADRESEKFITGVLRKNFPDHAILGEEGGFTQTNGSPGQTSDDDEEDLIGAGKNAALWMIDPLDGTTNYVHQFPFFAISMGLEVAGELVLGVIDAPKLGLRFHAVRGGGAFCNGQPIHVSNRTLMKDGLFATGFSSYDHTLDEQLEVLTLIIRHTRGIRRAGAAALDLCFVAQGVFDVFFEKNLSPWDTAAGVVIATEAGAVVTDMHGHSYDPRLKSILCGNPTLHGESLKLMQQIQKRRITEF